MEKEEAIKSGLFNIIGKDMDDKYIETLKGKILNPDIIKEQGKELKIVYTPLQFPNS